MPTIATMMPEYMTEPLEETAGGAIDFSAADHLLDLAADIICIGPGLGQDPSTVAFVQAVDNAIVDEIRKYDNTPLGHRAEIGFDPDDEEGDEIERPLEEYVADEQPVPETVLLNLEEDNRRHQLLRKACAAVTDEKMMLTPRDLTAEGVIKLSLGRKRHVLLRPV